MRVCGFDFSFLISLIRTCVPRATQGLRARSGSEPLHGSAWFGSVWGGFLGGILGGIARAGFSHRESALPDPLNY